VQAIASAGMAYGIASIKPGKLATILLSVFGVSESLNVYRNHRIGCE